MFTKSSENHIKRKILLIAIMLAMLFSLWILYTVIMAEFYVGKLGPQIRKEFGFKHNSPYIRAGDQQIEVFTIYPLSGGIFEKSGFREGDIVSDFNITEFYKLLHKSRGKILTIQVIEGGDGLPLHKRVSRNVEIVVPKSSIDLFNKD